MSDSHALVDQWMAQLENPLDPGEVVDRRRVVALLQQIAAQQAELIHERNDALRMVRHFKDSFGGRS